MVAHLAAKDPVIFVISWCRVARNMRCWKWQLWVQFVQSSFSVWFFLKHSQEFRLYTVKISPSFFQIEEMANRGKKNVLKTWRVHMEFRVWGETGRKWWCGARQNSLRVEEERQREVCHWGQDQADHANQPQALCLSLSLSVSFLSFSPLFSLHLRDQSLFFTHISPLCSTSLLPLVSYF